MSKGLGFLQSNIQNMLQTGEILTVSDVMAVAGPSYDPRHIRRAFKSMHRRDKVVLTVKRGVLAVKAKGHAQTAPPPVRQTQTPPPIRPVQVQVQRQAPAPAVNLGMEPVLSAADVYPAKVAREVERQKKEALQGTRRTTV
jgi:hypothetical protein